MSLYHKHRPNSLKQMVGQKASCDAIYGFMDNGFPHAIILVGPSGCGKTTLARIIGDKLECEGEDFEEKNCADFRGIDMVRDVRSRLGTTAMFGKNRVFYIDECHQLTKEAQSALLKMLEDYEENVYFILSTTHPKGLLETIITRCTTLRVNSLNRKQLLDLMDRVLTEEGVVVHKDILEKIVEVASGSARHALVELDKVYKLATEDEQLAAIMAPGGKAQSYDIAKHLVWCPQWSWKEVSRMLSDIEGEDPDGVRRIILDCAGKEILNGGKFASRASLLISTFQFNFYDSGRAGLINTCYNLLNTKPEK